MSAEEVDFAAYDKDEPGESKAAKAAVKAAAGKVAVQAAAGVDVGKEETMANFLKLAAENKKLKEDAMVREQTHADELAAANAKSAKKTRAPKGLYQTQCDDATKKIKPTIQYIKDNHNVHRDCYMLGLYLKDITDALPESADHEAYKRWLTDNKTFVGLKKQTRKSVTPASSPGAVSANVSRAASAAPVDDSIDESMEDYEQKFDYVPDAKGDAGAGAD